MAMPTQPDVHNRLLRALPPEVYACLKPLLRPAPVRIRQVLAAAGTTIQNLYFLETGIASVTSDGAKAQVEIALIGREGLVGAVPFLLGDPQAPYSCFVQLAGHALRIEGAALLAEMERSPILNRLLYRYIQTQFVQTAQVAYTNARATTEIRLARWLLMYQDRSEGDNIMVTQDFMSHMLGVERPGVTGALTKLKGRGLTDTRRGGVVILDRLGLVRLAGDTYGFPEAEYNRLIRNQ